MSSKNINNLKYPIGYFKTKNYSIKTMSLRDYSLCILKTNERIPKILEFLNSLKDDDKQIGPIRKDFYRDPETKEYFETDFRFIILRKDFMRKLRNTLNREQLDFCEFKLKNEHFAFSKSSTMNFYYPILKKINSNLIMNEKLKILVEMGFLEEGTWFIHEEFGICEFSNRVNDKQRAVIKIMCDHPSNFRVSWCRKSLFSKIVPHFN